MMRNAIWAVFLGVSLTLVGGCASHDNVQAPRGPVDDPLPEAAYPQIVLLNDLHKQLVGSHLRVDKPTEDRPMRVRATLRCVVEHEVSVQYRFVFMGSDGDAVGDDPSWLSVTFAPGTQRTLEQIAPSFKAVDWRLEVREYQ